MQRRKHNCYSNETLGVLASARLLLHVYSLLRLAANEVHQPCKRIDQENKLMRYINGHSCNGIEIKKLTCKKKKNDMSQDRKMGIAGAQTSDGI